MLKISFLFLYLLTDVDDCRSSPCKHGNCTDNINGYNCTCDTGYTGTSCDIGSFLCYLLKDSFNE